MNENNVKTGVYTDENGDEVAFTFLTSLGVVDKVSFVNFVSDTIIPDDSDNDSKKYYHHIIKDIIFDFAIVNVFTDVDTSDIGKSIEYIENFIDNTNIVDIVKANAKPGVIDELSEAVDLNIEYRTGIHRNPIATSLSDLFKTIERKIDNFDIDGVIEFAQKMNDISGELTAEKMLDAYAKSDMYKENLNKVVAEKNNSVAAVVSAFPIKPLSTNEKIAESFMASDNDMLN